MLPIIYSDKTEHVLEDAAFKGIYLDIRQMKPCSFAELMRDSQKQKIPNIRSLREASQAQFEVLDQFLLR